MPIIHKENCIFRRKNKKFEMPDWRDEEGVLIIEASISLSVFMFLIVTLLSVVNICYTQAKVGAALNETAKEISQYTYMYAVSDINKGNAKLYDDTDEARSKINEAIKGSGELYNAVQDGQEQIININLSNVEQTVEAIKNDANVSQETVKKLEELVNDIKDDPKAFLTGMGKLAICEGEELLKEKLAQVLAKALIERHLKSDSNQDTESFLKFLRVIPAANGKYIDGMDFRGSTMYKHGGQEIYLVVCYRIKVVPLLPINMEYTFCQSAQTEGWGGK